MVVSGAIALGLLGFGGYIFWTNRQKNTQIEVDLQSKRAELDRINSNVNSPSPNETNIAAAEVELKKVRDIIQRTKTQFAPIPVQEVTGPDFRTLLDRTIFELRSKAESQGITLPARDYAFSFEAQKKTFTFGEGTFPMIPQQLAEVSTICHIIFDAQINRFGNVKRTRVSANDEANKGAPDYHDVPIQTNATTGCISTPYMFEIQCFSQKLGKLLEGLERSTNGLLLKSILVEPLPLVAEATGQPTPPGATGLPPPVAHPVPGMPPRPVVPQQKPHPLGRTVLDERMLKVMMMVEVIKCVEMKPKG